MKISRFAVELKNREIKIPQKCIKSYTAKLKCREK